MAQMGEGLKNFGETAARRALREKTVAVIDAIQRHLAVFPRYLIQTSFMTESQWEVASTTPVSNAEKANCLYMRAVKSKVDNNPDRGREWLKKLMGILMRQDIGEYIVAQDMAKVYSKYSSSKYIHLNYDIFAVEYADSGTDDFVFFKKIAHPQGMGQFKYNMLHCIFS